MLIAFGLLLVIVGPSLQRAAAARHPKDGAAGVFISLRWHQIDWWAVLLIGVGSFLGGFLGSGIGRRLHPVVLRAVIVAVGVAAILWMTVWT